MYKVKITVFTPTYNRAYTLERLYKSLLNQTSYDFEWLIVDDGSTDDTSELIKSFQNNHFFDVRYYKQENSGKHVAINNGVDLAEGELFFIVDSDDYLTDDAIEKIISWSSTLPSNDTYAGVSGNRGYSVNELIGTTFSGGYIDATALEREKYSITGDKAEVFFTHVLRKYKFPVFENEKFMTENVVWYAIAADGYKIRWFNEIIYITEYLPDGLTHKYNKLLATNPKGFAVSVNQKIKIFNLSKKQIYAEYFNYFQTVKGSTNLRNAAKNLGITNYKICYAIVLFYKDVAIRKIKEMVKK